VKKIRNVLILLSIFILSLCNPINTSSIKSLNPPIILIIKTDSVVVVEGSKGKKCIVNTIDKIDYYIAFLKVGDTLKIN